MIGLIEHSAAPNPPDYLATVVGGIFADGGSLASGLGLSHRPQQAAMAEAVATALQADSPLLFEAGTGVGKSLAYLIPGIIRAVETGRPLLVSSHTITLQEQIHRKDLDICRKLFENTPALQRYARFEAALLVGKANYCCGTRLARALREAENPHQTELFDSHERAELRRLAEWIKTSPTGTRQELSPAPDPEIWDKVNAESSVCSRKNCSPDNCPYQRARSQLAKANVIIVNHSLLFSLLNAGMSPGKDKRGILFPDDSVVLDEAHRVPAIATEHFGLNLSSFGVDRSLRRLYNPKKGRGFLSRFKSHYDVACVEEAIAANLEFFDNIGENVLRGNRLVRIVEPEICLDVLGEPLQNLADRLAAHLQREDDEAVRAELMDHRRRLLGVRQAVTQFIALGEEDHVHWIERGGKSGKIISLRTAPLDVAPYLREALFSRGSAAILTSATLSDGESMESFKRQVGADKARAEIRTSPFDFEQKCRIYLATDVPEPSRQQGQLDIDYLAEAIEWASLRCPGGTLVLCTSHADVRLLTGRLHTALRKAGRPLYSQGMDYSRSTLVERFRKDGNAVLLGTDSFWTGVDVPGPSLSQVIVPRLPFENPSHPVIQARSEHIQQQGGNPFVEMTLADALVKFRQGIGRLIRTQEDCGVLMLLDSRITKRPYGAKFLAALPTQQIARFTRDTRESVIDYQF